MLIFSASVTVGFIVARVVVVVGVVVVGMEVLVVDLVVVVGSGVVSMLVDSNRGMVVVSINTPVD